jgi:hypothetical protein
VAFDSLTVYGIRRTAPCPPSEVRNGVEKDFAAQSSSRQATNEIRSARDPPYSEAGATWRTSRTTSGARACSFIICSHVALGGRPLKVFLDNGGALWIIPSWLGGSGLDRRKWLRLTPASTSGRGRARSAGSIQRNSAFLSQRGAIVKTPEACGEARNC